MPEGFVIPTKISSYLRRLSFAYKERDEKLYKLVTTAKVFVREGDVFDNWDGGTYGHTIVLFCGEKFFSGVSLEDQVAVRDRLLDDLRNVSSGNANEFVSAVQIELEDQLDPEFQKANNFFLDQPVPLDTVRFWHPEYVRLFVSHRDIHKAEAKKLADQLLEYGISAFVAHDTIEPMSTWQKEIEKGLSTMEVMLCFVTDNFHDSVWTNQEVGYALGRKTPIISLKLEKSDPSGFIGAEQALRGSLASPCDAVEQIFKLIAEKVGFGARMQKALVEALVQSTSYDEAGRRFERLAKVTKSITENEFLTIQKGFDSNGQLNGCYKLTHNDRLLNFLARTTGKSLAIAKGKIVEVEDEVAIPF